jgi:serine/threonine protein kinase
MGEVYRGTDTLLERAVAIKFLTRNSAAHSVPEQLLTEARSASALSHPNVCTIYEVSESDGRPCIVMEYVEGRRLSMIIPPGVGLSTETAVSYGMQIADALAHAHDAGVIHRDLKSANIIVTPQQRVKVLDFGLAVQEADQGVDDETSTVDDWRSGSEPGTPGTLRYLAPEVLRGERADRQSDIWALGAVLYEMAAGKRPFNGRTPHEISAAILIQAPEPLPSEVPSGLRSIIRTCLTKERARRYHSASEVRAALEALREVQSEGATSISRRAAVLLGIGLLAAVVIALTMSMFALMRRDEVATLAERTADAAGQPASKYLAVLPQLDSSSPSDQTALTETIVERMIYRITSINLPGLKVIAFPTVFRFQSDSRDPIAKAREELDAAFVVTIKVSIEKQRLTFTAALADTADRSQIWGQPYEAMPDEIFTIEGTVAQQIAETLLNRLSPKTVLTPAQSSKLTEQPTQNFTALRLYAEGRRLWYIPTPTPDAYKNSIAFYDKAIQQDPKFALAYLGKADTIGGMAWEGWIPPSQAYEATAEALEQVERIAPHLGQSRHTRAWLKSMDKDWAGAERDYRSAIDADPSLPMNRRFFALFLAGRGRLTEALQVLQDALDRDPQGLGTNLALATTLYWAGDLDKAIVRLNEMIYPDASDPATAVAREILADVYETKGRLGSAIAQRAKALRINGEAQEADDLERDYRTSGFKAAMHNFYKDQLTTAAAQLMNGTYVSPVYLALLFVGLNDPDKAFQYLDAAIQEKAPWLQYLRVDPAFKSIRSDPRFEPLVRRFETPAPAAAAH